MEDVARLEEERRRLEEEIQRARATSVQGATERWASFGGRANQKSELGELARDSRSVLVISTQGIDPLVCLPFCGTCQLCPGLLGFLVSVQRQKGMECGKLGAPCLAPPLPGSGCFCLVRRTTAWTGVGRPAGGWEAGAGTQREPCCWHGRRWGKPPLPLISFDTPPPAAAGEPAGSVAARSRQPGTCPLPEAPPHSLSWALGWHRRLEASSAPQVFCFATGCVRGQVCSPHFMAVRSLSGYPLSFGELPPHVIIYWTFKFSVLRGPYAVSV